MLQKALLVEKMRTGLIKGVRVGIIAFLVCFGISLIIALILNSLFLGSINNLINGSLSADPKSTLSSGLIINAIIINLSVFNRGSMLDNGGSLHIGMLIFAVLPMIAFFIADFKDNKKRQFEYEDFFEYAFGSGVFSILVYLYSMITKGELLGISIDFTLLTNFFMTWVISFMIQLMIGLNYNKTLTPGIRVARFQLRVILLVSMILSLIGLFVLLSKYINNIGLLIISLIFILPNLMVYVMFTFMGASIEFGDQLVTLMNKAGIDLSFTTLDLPIRIVLIVSFFILVFISIWRLGRERFLEELFLFATSFSTISLILAYCTTMNLGFVKNLLDVQFGINLYFAFILPFVIILIVGIMMHVVRIMMKEVKGD